MAVAYALDCDTFRHCRRQTTACRSTFVTLQDQPIAVRAQSGAPSPIPPMSPTPAPATRDQPASPLTHGWPRRTGDHQRCGLLPGVRMFDGLAVRLRCSVGHGASCPDENRVVRVDRAPHTALDVVLDCNHTRYGDSRSRFGVATMEPRDHKSWKNRQSGCPDWATRHTGIARPERSAVDIAP